MDKAIKDIKGNSRIIIAYMIASVLILSSYLASMYSNRQLIKQSKKVDHTNEVILNLQMLISAVKDVENATRGYVLSKNIQFLTPYYGKRELTDSIEKNLSVLLSDNLKQLERLKFLKEKIGKRIDIADFSIKDFEAKGMVLSDTLKSLRPEVLELTSEIAKTSKEMQELEKGLLTQRNDQLQQSFNSIDIINFISLIIASFLIIFAIFTFLKERKARNLGIMRISSIQDELRKRVEDLDHANRELIHMKGLEKFTSTGRIARTIAHEVRNPLTNINLATDQLKVECEKGDETLPFLELIERNSERINQLISNLLNATKFSELNFASISINKLVDEALDDAADRIAIRNISIEKKYEADLCNVKADSEKIKIAFLNIIINAIEAISGTGKPGKIIVETKKEDGKCKVLFSDNGPGMDNDTLQKIFEPYYTMKSKGTGLGLTNTQNIILNHKGDIFITSEKGRGTNVIVILDFEN